MRGTVLVSNPQEFPTFQLAHRFEAGEHRFEVAYGTSFNELYYEFSPKEFVSTTDRAQIAKQFDRVGLDWLTQLLDDLAAGDAGITSEELLALIQSRS